MNLTRPSPTPARYTGIGLVVALHLAGIYALSAGLIQPPARQPGITTLKPLPPDIQEPPPRVEPLQVAEPKFTTPRIEVPVPTDVVEAPAEPTLVAAVPLRADSTPQPTGPARVADAATLPAVTKPLISTPGAVCSVMPKPDVPAVNWSGEAVLQVLATVKGGRVVGSEVRLAQGAPDAKTRRSLQRSVETALAGYQCQGDATFQQDFAFRLD
ncbi:hypothetical protein ACG02S_22185 [Roseateles sp. DC23W]|uniref:Protein TonB n=1 Tax=Pelomonas dachongensis TaxID=3299029 RepID=A0ABW7ESX4_9BURK